MWTLSFCREACKYTNIIYEWETLHTPCLEKNIRYIGPVVATITGQNATDHILCQVRALYFLPEIQQSQCCVVQDQCDLSLECYFWTFRIWSHQPPECVLLQNKTSSEEDLGRISGATDCIQINRRVVTSTKKPKTTTSIP